MSWFDDFLDGQERLTPEETRAVQGFFPTPQAFFQKVYTMLAESFYNELRANPQLTQQQQTDLSNKMAHIIGSPTYLFPHSLIISLLSRFLHCD
jgi:hypothetical protein